MNFNTVLAILGIILILAIGGVIGWFIRPVPVPHTVPATVIIRQDSAAFLQARAEARLISTQRDSLQDLLFKSRSRTGRLSSTAQRLSDSIKALLASRNIDSILVYSKDTTQNVPLRARIPLSPNKDTTISMMLRVWVGWTLIPQLDNYYSQEILIDSTAIPFMMVEYQSNKYTALPLDILWGTYGLSYHRQTVGFPLALGFKDWYVKFTPYIKQEPAYEVGKKWRLF